jgi:hypothetical protein
MLCFTTKLVSSSVRFGSVRSLGILNNNESRDERSALRGMRDSLYTPH